MEVAMHINPEIEQERISLNKEAARIQVRLDAIERHLRELSRRQHAESGGTNASATT
jgi:hypothetical protein